MTEKIALFDRVALTRDLPGDGLYRGDVATVVDQVEAEGYERGYVLEVFNALGETIKVIDVPASAVAPLSADSILSIRSLAHSA